MAELFSPPSWSLWKERAVAAQLRIWDRFRVAVDRRRRWPDDSDHSAILQRWILRFRGILGAPSSSSCDRPSSPYSKFYLKRVGKNVEASDNSIIIRALQALAVHLIGSACHVFMHGFNDIQVFGAEKLHEAVLRRPEGKPLITMGMDMAISKLNSGGWVHIFPEGSRSRDGGRTLGSIKRGVARLALDSDNTPIIIPFVHTGMQDVMPIGANIPKIGKRVIILVGDPISFDDLLADKELAHDDSMGVLYDAVSSRISCRLHELKAEVDILASEQPCDIREDQTHNSRRAHGIWQQVDWEAFGMEFGSSSDAPLTTASRHHQDSAPDQRLANPTSEHSRAVRVNLSYDRGIVSRIRGYMNPTELMGFAARGVFMNGGCHMETMAL